MKLHTNKQDLSELIRLTATHFGILPEFIEKDYWITLILNNLSQSLHKNSVVFKGGTSLTAYFGDTHPAISVISTQCFY